MLAEGRNEDEIINFLATQLFQMISFKIKTPPHDLEKVKNEQKHEERGTVGGGPERG